LIGLARSVLYDKPKPPVDEAALKKRIEELAADPSFNGRRRTTEQLKREGFVVNHKKVGRIRRERGLLPRRKRRWIRTTDSRHGLPIYPNLLKGLEPTGPDQAWVADITYVALVRGFVYVAVILDRWSRRALGWAIGERIDADLTLSALRQAIRVRRPSPGIIHHSDRGVQYAATVYVKELEQSGFRISMSRRGNPYDNAWAESFMSTLKRECVHLWEYRDVRDVLARIPEFIEDVYNTKRLHSALGYLPPAEFEALNQAQVACPVIN
jgi:putative transposase